MTSSRQSRRSFLKLLSSGTCGALVHRMLPPTAGIMALARPLEAHAASNKVMVIINLSGGCSYNIASPLGGVYQQRNPSVSYNATTGLQVTNDQVLHPSLTGLKTIWDEGNLALINLVGYPNQNRSHDESTAIWHSGLRSMGGGGEGWGARLTSQMASAFGGVSLSGSNVFVKGGVNPPRVVSDLSSFGERPFLWNDTKASFLRDSRTMMLIDETGATNEAEQYAQDSLIRLESNIDSLKQIGAQTLPVTFPNTGIGSRLRDAAKLIAAGGTLNTQVIYTEQGGYDTHSDERTRQAQLLAELNAAVTAFVSCMKSLQRWNDVVLCTMTEFTRTMENNSRGTDHGAAGPLFVLGGSVRGGQKGPAPTDTEVAGFEYIRARHFNFSQVYGEVIAHMGLDPARAFPSAEFAPSPYLGLF